MNSLLFKIQQPLLVAIHTHLLKHGHRYLLHWAFWQLKKINNNKLKKLFVVPTLLTDPFAALSSIYSSLMFQVRMSVGLEDLDDIIEDLKQALLVYIYDYMYGCYSCPPYIPTYLYLEGKKIILIIIIFYFCSCT